jgi:hypothetical protein
VLLMARLRGDDHDSFERGLEMLMAQIRAEAR